MTIRLKTSRSCWFLGGQGQGRAMLREQSSMCVTRTPASST
ncbi:hypothetical protein CSPAE12_02272 [Colletotrichum incanum]|nr:hypothetical protein CSPAE12_02272 [Colletotrichum incanum]